MRISIVVAALALVGGCSGGGGDGPEGRSCLATFGYQYDQISNTGLTLRATVPQYTFITFEEMEAEYIDLEACAANTGTPGPTVNFTGFEHLGLGGGYAVYSYASQDIYINTDDLGYGPRRNCISDRKFLRHEYMHHVLFLNGEDSSHNNAKFKSCNALGPKTCNGEYCE